MGKPLIFVTNDDGSKAKGFNLLIEALRPFGRIVAVVPSEGRSGMSQAFTMSAPLFLNKIRDEEDVQIYECSGTPVDCVKLTFDYMFTDEKPVLNISGINHGSNAAVNVLYSGTMGAAIEASFYKIPTVGLSLCSHDADADFEAAIAFTKKLVPAVLAMEHKDIFCLNVNIPVARPDQIKGCKVCRQTRGYWREVFEKRYDPRGREYFWLTGSFVNWEPQAEDTDEWALANGYIAVVPVCVDMTNYEQCPFVERLLERL
ncbi:MAG: 5'/3'-nucleotidase SurE [Tidjanibacter sp.]|nr:5'/3'-nucleotidase SurE [Tidjanibacter sp.]